MKPWCTPFLKWVGGKGMLLGQLAPLLPAGVEHMRHVEPFLGGGALLLARRPARALVGDANGALVATYQAVRDDLPAMILELERLVAAHGAGSYEAERARFNAGIAERPALAAAFIYLNKTGFNGLFRTNAKGEMNVPKGRGRALVFDTDTLHRASLVLQRAEIRHAPFEELLEQTGRGDFVYLDPPYEPAGDGGFVAYGKDGFTRHDQARLRDHVLVASSRGARVMVSNSDVPFIRELYRSPALRIDTIHAPRSVNAKGAGRGLVREVVIRNYASA